ncbi:hypothetical protein MBLNU459_g3486t1 [Dothideomycetes sp. NU459]
MSWVTKILSGLLYKQLVAVLFCYYFLCGLLGHAMSLPCLKIANFTTLWKVYHLTKGTYEEKTLRSHREDGPLVRVGPREFSISSYDMFLSQIETSEELSLSSCIFALSNNRIVSHNQHRSAKDFPAFSLDSMTQAIPNERLIDGCNKALLQTIWAYASREDAVQLRHLITCYAWDMLGATTIGERFGFLEINNSDVVEVTNNLNQWKLYAVLYGTYFRFHPWISMAYQKSGLSTTLTLSHQKLNGAPNAATPDKGHCKTVRDILNQKECTRNNTLEKVDSLAALAALSSDNNVSGQDESLAIVVALLLAESDPIIAHIYSTISHLAENPKTVNDLREEFAALKRPLSQPPKASELVQLEDGLPLLNAVLLESQRLQLLEDFQYTRIAGDNGMSIAGREIPGGSTIRFSAYAASRDSSIYGHTADDWDPSRWLDSPNSPMLAFGQTFGNDRIAKALVAKIITQIVCLYDITTKEAAGGNHEKDTAEQKYRQIAVVFRALPSTNARSHLASSLVSNFDWHGDAPKGERLDDLEFMCDLIGNSDAEKLFLAANGPIESLDARLTTFGVLKTDPILDRGARGRFNKLVRILFDGKLETETDADKCINIRLTGTGSSYHNENRNLRGGKNSRLRSRSRVFRGRGNDQRGNERKYTTTRRQRDNASPSYSLSTCTTDECGASTSSGIASATPPLTPHAAKTGAWRAFATAGSATSAAMEAGPAPSTPGQPMHQQTLHTTFKQTSLDNEDWLTSGGKRRIISVEKPATLVQRRDAAKNKDRADKQPFVEDE